MIHDDLDERTVEPDEPTAAVPTMPPEEPIPTPLTGAYSFLSGVAGSGKTWLLRRMVRELPGTLLCSTTGISAVNLGEGTTINAALRYYDTASLMDAYTRGGLTGTLGKLWRSGVRRLVLDEVSMMDAEQLTIITRALEELRGRGYVMNQALADEVLKGSDPDDDEERSRRGISLLTCGDFLQLPPVKAKFAFESPEWTRYGSETTSHKLTTIRRQVDPGFIAAMQAARCGDKDGVVEYFRHRLEATSDRDFQGMTVVATNDAADRINAMRLDTLKGHTVSIPSSSWGKQRGDWRNIPAVLQLKAGAIVMVLANRRDPIDERPPHQWPIVYANGDMGTVVDIDVDRGVVRVRLDRTNKVEVVDWVTRQNTIPMEPGRKSELRAEGNDHLISADGKWETVGEITYVPLRLGWASTTHKCQGLSLDRVQVVTGEGMFRNAGLLYVALTRARTPEGLRLVGTVDGLRERVTVHPQVKQWI